jgi:very-short-patch-repair endonuclease
LRQRHLIDRAKAMRREMTPPERRLWLELKAKRFGGAKFRRQQVIGSYIADFACRMPMLIIEVDGESHADRQDYDETRTLFLKARGYRVLRFKNADVMRNLDGVLVTIASALETPPLPALSPEGERG